MAELLSVEALTLPAWSATLPESDILDVREYIYVDTNRVRSLLAQMTDGLPDEKSTTKSRSSRLRLGTKLAGFEGGRDGSASETLALADLHVSMMEEAATSLGLLTDASERVRREKFWLRGKVRAQLEPGMLLRVTAPTQLIDPNSLMSTLRGFQAAVEASQDDEFEQFLAIVEALYGSALALSIRPTEPASGRAAFVGNIPLDHGFEPLFRDLLLSRIGPDPAPMTAIIQIARVPTQHDTGMSAEQQLGMLFKRLEATSSEVLDRDLLDTLIAQLGGLLEQYGFAAAPKWPAISVVPLALYRNVIPVPAWDEGGDGDEDDSAEFV